MITWPFPKVKNAHNISGLKKELSAFFSYIFPISKEAGIQPARERTESSSVKQVLDLKRNMKPEPVSGPFPITDLSGLSHPPLWNVSSSLLERKLIIFFYLFIF